MQRVDVQSLEQGMLNMDYGRISRSESLHPPRRSVGGTRH